MNVCTLVGRIGTDPDLRYTSSGTPVVQFRLGVRRRVRGGGGGDQGQRQQQDTDWITIVAFGKTAEFVSQYLDKGAQIGVTGNIRARVWEPEGGGQRKEFVEVVADNIEFMETRAEAEARRAGSGGRGPSGGGQPGRGGGRGMEDMPPPDELELPPDEEIFGDL
jgi:single-strand DNA-binding protein